MFMAKQKQHADVVKLLEKVRGQQQQHTGAQDTEYTMSTHDCVMLTAHNTVRDSLKHTLHLSNEL